MPTAQPTPSDAAFTALADADVALPAAALDALVAHARRDPAGRVELRAALLHRPELAPADAAALLGDRGRRAPIPVTVAWLLRAEHTADQLRAALDADDRPTVLTELAEAATSSATLLDLLAGRGRIGVAVAVLRHRNSSDTARLTALARMDEFANSFGLRTVENAYYQEFTAAIGVGVDNHLAAPAADVCSNAVLLTAIADRPLPDAAHRRIIDLCLQQPLTTGIGLPGESVITRLLRALGQHATEATRRHAAAVLRGAWRGALTRNDIDKLLGLATEQPRHQRTRSVAETRWPTLALDADHWAPTVATDLAALLTDGLGEDPDAWRALTGLAEHFTGTVTDLIAAANGVAAPRS